MGTFKGYWPINLTRLINSIILCKHWRWDRSVSYFSGRKKILFWLKKKKKNFRKSLPHIFNLNQSKKLAVHRMPFVVYRSGAEIFRGLLSSLSDRKPCKTKIIAFIGRSCKLLAECQLIAYPSQACSVSRTHTVEVATKGRSSFLGAGAGDFCIRNVWGFWSVRRNEYWWLDKYLTNPMNLCTAGTSSSLHVR